jgi:hypothetical protein
VVSSNDFVPRPQLYGISCAPPSPVFLDGGRRFEPLFAKIRTRSRTQARVLQVASPHVLCPLSKTSRKLFASCRRREDKGIKVDDKIARAPRRKTERGKNVAATKFERLGQELVRRDLKANKALNRTAGQRHNFHDLVSLNVGFLSTVILPRCRLAPALAVYRYAYDYPHVKKKVARFTSIAKLT